MPKKTISTARCGSPRCRCNLTPRCRCHDLNALLALTLWDFSRRLHRHHTPEPKILP
ncbi:MAG: hypothetical protein KIT44_03300 [Opitutaceae bacterium]|nr:hypothetical protein [Opitutaceae bacterium]